MSGEPTIFSSLRLSFTVLFPLVLRTSAPIPNATSTTAAV
jgi:hypothetical protein